jgi:hypothetical protein
MICRIIIIHEMKDMQEMKDLQGNHYTGDARHAEDAGS